MSKEDPADRPPVARPHWYLWIIAGAVSGAFAGAAGILIGAATEALIVLIVNAVPGGQRQTAGITGLMLLLGCVAGGLIMASPLAGAADDAPHEVPRFLLGAAIGGAVAIVDRIFVWVAFPEGDETPPENIDEPETDADDTGEPESGPLP
jgi:hypothetical protein